MLVFTKPNGETVRVGESAWKPRKANQWFAPPPKPRPEIYTRIKQVLSSESEAR